MKKIIVILGTRPEIIKLSPMIPLLEKQFQLIIVHTGQHYSYNMDKLFFEELKLPEPKYKLEVGSGSHAYQTGTMMMKIEEVCLKEKPDLILVQGDTNSTLSGTLVAAKLSIPLAHIEAGYRSFNIKMPEEINRIISDRFSEYLFVGDETGVKNIQQEGINNNKIYLVGNTAIDALRRNEKLSSDSILSKLSLKKEGYVLVTFHRAGNTDDPSNLRNIVDALNYLSQKMRFVFPIHPRTKEALEKNDLSLSPNILIIEPVGYLDMISLMKYPRFIMTDSGGIQEESAELNIPCLVLRDETEAVEILNAGKTRLATTETEKIIQCGESLINCDHEIEKIKNCTYIGKVGVAEKIAEILNNKINNMPVEKINDVSYGN